MKIAIIGASTGQLTIYKKAKEMGLFVIGFAWSEGAICKSLADEFYDISILEMDRIVELCKEECVSGVVSNASELTSRVVSYVSEKLGLIGLPYETILAVKDKFKVRELTKNIEGLSAIKYMLYSNNKPESYPCVVKPVTGAGKCGVSFVKTESEFGEAIEYCTNSSKENILIEEYIDGREVSVESISFKGQHYVIQITDKEGTGAPHFVEIGHHQPSTLSPDIQDKIRTIVPQILDVAHFTNGASHIELKIKENGEIYLIEINSRGGGDEISNSLVHLSTDYDYVKAMIEVAIGTFEKPTVHNTACSGIYFLCKQTEYLKPLFMVKDRKWIVERKCNLENLNISTSNRDRNGFLIYRDSKKITLENYNK